MSEENGAGGPVKRFIAGLPVFFREKILTWELVKRFAVCLFFAAALLIESVSCYLAGVNKSVFNPFFQGLWLYLAIFGLSILPGGKAARFLLSFWVLFLGILAAAGAFLYLRFGLAMDCDCFFVAAASSTTETREFLEQFLTWRLTLLILLPTAAAVGLTVLIWKTKYRRSRLNTVIRYE